jgi:hypothetical protein
MGVVRASTYEPVPDLRIHPTTCLHRVTGVNSTAVERASAWMWNAAVRAHLPQRASSAISVPTDRRQDRRVLTLLRSSNRERGMTRSDPNATCAQLIFSISLSFHVWSKNACFSLRSRSLDLWRKPCTVKDCLFSPIRPHVERERAVRSRQPFPDRRLAVRTEAAAPDPGSPQKHLRAGNKTGPSGVLSLAGPSSQGAA